MKLAGKTAVVGTGLAAGAALLGAQPAAANHLAGFGHYNDQGTSRTTLVGGPGGGDYAFRVNDLSDDAGSGIQAFVGAIGVNVIAGGDAVKALSFGGTGVNSLSVEGNAIAAEIREGNGFNAVYATCGGSGNGVFGEVTNTSGTGNAVLGIHKGPGNAVFGYKPTGAAGDAVVGYSQTGRGVFGVSTNGRGGAFSGKKAQVQLQASAATTHPGTGARGDLFVDNSGRLWFCKGSTTWKQLA